jgi:hypothetical protein
MPALSLTPSTETIRKFTDKIDLAVVNLMKWLPPVNQLSGEQRRAIIARYSIVLETNFIHWMSATLISVRSQHAQAIAAQNLREEISENHPGMMRRFTTEAKALPGPEDHECIAEPLEHVRKVVAELDGTKLLVMMLFFEQFIADFMPYLAEIAKAQGSGDFQYTDVHAKADVEHSAQLTLALMAEIDESKNNRSVDELFEGAAMLSRLIRTIVSGKNCLRRV